MHFPPLPPSLFNPRKHPKPIVPLTALVAVTSQQILKIWERGGRGSKGSSTPPPAPRCHWRARNQLTAHPLFPWLRLQELRVRSTMGTAGPVLKGPWRSGCKAPVLCTSLAGTWAAGPVCRPSANRVHSLGQQFPFWNSLLRKQLPLMNRDLTRNQPEDWISLLLLFFQRLPLASRLKILRLG